eukprot:m.7359 g.7359  ORF g.7359 m.7359 type:complete len:620 (+) comp18475_c0_seq1:293-2152(+)
MLRQQNTQPVRSARMSVSWIYASRCRCIRLTAGLLTVRSIVSRSRPRLPLTHTSWPVSNFQSEKHTYGKRSSGGAHSTSSDCITKEGNRLTSLLTATDDDGGPSIFSSNSQPNYTMTTASSLGKGKTIGGYLIGKTIGEGSFAKVKEAVHLLTNQKVAVKVLEKTVAMSNSYLQRSFRRESLMLQKIRHRNVVRLYEVLESENHFYLVTELVSGGELQKHIGAKGRLDENETRKYIRQITFAVEYMHKAGVIHRDLKVENLLLDENYDVKIIDFGLSNALEEGGHLMTQCGSPAYAAPEVFSRKPYDAAVDVWSIGINMYAMLTGELPFHVEPMNTTTLHALILMGAKIPDTLSPDCQDLLRKLLQIRPDNRIKVADILHHPWITANPEEVPCPLEPAPFPNFPTQECLDDKILTRMTNFWGYDREKTVKHLCDNRASPATATYYLVRDVVQRTKERNRQSRRIRTSCSDSQLDVKLEKLRLRKTGSYELDVRDLREVSAAATAPAEKSPSRRPVGAGIDREEHVNEALPVATARSRRRSMQQVTANGKRPVQFKLRKMNRSASTLLSPGRLTSCQKQEMGATAKMASLTLPAGSHLPAINCRSQRQSQSEHVHSLVKI